MTPRLMEIDKEMDSRVGYASLSILASFLRTYTKEAIERGISCENEIIKLNALENYLNDYGRYRTE